MGRRHVFGKAFGKPRVGAPEEVVHAEMGELVHEEVFVWFGRESGGAADRWLKKDVGPDEHMSVATTVVSR